MGDARFSIYLKALPLNALVRRHLKRFKKTGAKALYKSNRGRCGGGGRGGVGVGVGGGGGRSWELA
jgi:hypothetical protein